MAKKRSSRRRRRRGLLGRLLRPLSVLLAAAAIVAALTLFFKVDKVEVSGNIRYDAGEIIAASGVEQGDNLILLNRYGISRRLYTQMPYITDARVYPKFPDTLMIEVTETRAIAAVPGAGAYWLLNAGEDRIKILEMAEEAQAQDYLLLSGLEAADPQAGRSLVLSEDSRLSEEKLLELLQAMEQLNMAGRIDSVAAGDREKLVLSCDGRFQVEVAYNADFSFKLKCLQEVVGKLEPNETGILRMTRADNVVNFIPYGH